MLKVNVNLDTRLAMIEQRGLQFLLRDGYLELYKNFLSKPMEYQNYIRSIALKYV